MDFTRTSAHLPQFNPNPIILQTKKYKANLVIIISHILLLKPPQFTIGGRSTPGLPQVYEGPDVALEGSLLSEIWQAGSIIWKALFALQCCGMTAGWDQAGAESSGSLLFKAERWTSHSYLKMTLPRKAWSPPHKGGSQHKKCDHVLLSHPHTTHYSVKIIASLTFTHLLVSTWLNRSFQFSCPWYLQE